MDELKILLTESLTADFISAVISNPKNKDGVTKIKVRPILKKNQLLFQLESYKKNQAFHENLDANKAVERVLQNMGEFVLNLTLLVCLFQGITLHHEFRL